MVYWPHNKSFTKIVLIRCLPKRLPWLQMGMGYFKFQKILSHVSWPSLLLKHPSYILFPHLNLKQEQPIIFLKNISLNIKGLVKQTASELSIHFPPPPLLEGQGLPALLPPCRLPITACPIMTANPTASAEIPSLMHPMLPKSVVHPHLS